MKSKLFPVALLLACSLMAQQPAAPGGLQPRGTPRVTALKDALGLSDAQVTQLTQIIKDRNAATRPLFTQIADKQRTLRDTLKAGGANAEQVGQLELDIAALRKQLRDTIKQYGDQARGLLDATQLTKLKAIEDAAKLMAAAREAIGLNLIEGPSQGLGGGPMGFGSRAGMMRRQPSPGPR